MIRKLLLTAAVAVVLMSVSAATYANTITFTGATGVTATVSDFTLTNNTFTFTVTNTSVAPGPTGTITNIGFNLPGTFNAASFTGTGGDFTLQNNVNANATGLNTTLDFALLTNKSNGTSSNNFNGGFVASGIAPGESVTFSITGDFTGLSANDIARSILLRFQAINNSLNGQTSDVAGPGGGGTAPVPEPATMFLLGTGLAGVAAKIRKRRKVSEV